MKSMESTMKPGVLYTDAADDDANSLLHMLRLPIGKTSQ